MSGWDGGVVGRWVAGTGRSVVGSFVVVGGLVGGLVGGGVVGELVGGGVVGGLVGGGVGGRGVVGVGGWLGCSI